MKKNNDELFLSKLNIFYQTELAKKCNNRMSVNYFRGSSTFFVSYANDDDSDAFVGHFIYHVDGEHDYYPDTGKIKIEKGFCVIGG